MENTNIHSQKLEDLLDLFENAENLEVPIGEGLNVARNFIYKLREESSVYELLCYVCDKKIEKIKNGEDYQHENYLLNVLEKYAPEYKEIFDLAAEYISLQKEYEESGSNCDYQDMNKKKEELFNDIEPLPDAEREKLSEHAKYLKKYSFKRNAADTYEKNPKAVLSVTTPGKYYNEYNVAYEVLTTLNVLTKNDAKTNGGSLDSGKES